MELVMKKEYGKMPALVAGKIDIIPITEAVKELKTLRPEFYRLAKVFFG